MATIFIKLFQITLEILLFALNQNVKRSLFSGYVLYFVLNKAINLSFFPFISDG